MKQSLVRSPESSLKQKRSYTFNSPLKLFCVLLTLCAAHRVCESQIIQGATASYATPDVKDWDGYPYVPPVSTNEQVKYAARSQYAVINYLGAPTYPDHFSNKLTYYLSTTVSPRNVIEAALIAGAPNLPAAPTQPAVPIPLNAATGLAYEAAFQTYGDQIDTWRRTGEVELRYRGNRAAVGLATSETRMFLSNFLLPVTLRQDARYEPADIDAPFGSRMGHAFASIVVARSDSGKLVPNYSKLIGTAGAAVVGRFYYADAFAIKGLDSSRFIGKYIGYSLAGDLATNVGRELVRSAIKPDIIRADESGASLQEGYYPLSVGGKFFNWTRSTYGARNSIEGGLMAGIPDVPDEPVFPAEPQINSVADEFAYDQQLTQYGAAEQLWRDNLEENIRYHGRRFIGGMAESETQTTLAKLILPATLRMDPRYIPLGPGHGSGARMANAFAGLVIARTDSGRRAPNVPLLAGNVGAALIAKEYYYPQLGITALDSNQVLEKTIGFNLAGDLILNLISEFFPHRTF